MEAKTFFGRFCLCFDISEIYFPDMGSIRLFAFRLGRFKHALGSQNVEEQEMGGIKYVKHVF